MRAYSWVKIKYVWVRVKFGYKQTDYTANEGEKQSSLYCRLKRWRRHTNCNDDRSSWRMENSADSQIGSKQKQRITLQTAGEKQKSVSTEDRSVEHNDYDSRRRTNYGDDRRIMLGGG